MSDKLVITLADGKYTYIREGHKQHALRYGEQWQDLVGNSFVWELADRIAELQAHLERTKDGHQAVYSDFIKANDLLKEKDARIAAALTEIKRLREALNKAGALALQKASHEYIRQVLAEALQQEGRGDE